ncbi:MAG: universal stress protein [Helicobacteraceae bacterium]|jgi:nucleotide-binding universal stress UspA family protein|nr:universal stress protein [Helicobacteraceae bacterium]
MALLHNILAAIDTSAMADEVLKRAITLAEEEGAQITILHCIDIPLVDKLFGDVDGDASIRKKIALKMDALIGEAPVEYLVTLTRGKPSDEIVYMSDKMQSDLIIIGAHGKKSIKDTFFGSTAHHVAQKSHRPVLIIKQPLTDNYKNILALTDLSEASKKSIQFAQGLFPNADINISYAYTQISDLRVDFYNLETKRENYKEIVRAKVEQDVETFQQSVEIDNTEVIEGFDPVGEMLLETAIEQKSDLVVLGTHGVKVSDTILYGSTASYLMKTVPSDVLIYVPLEK